ncbi:MAG: cation:proton antiporter [Persephonella sp.]|nr:MAG: cation:proton antiporter [Persephonella sp.]
MEHSTNIPFLLIFGIITVVLFIAGYIGKLLKFPSILFYILAGLLLGQFLHENEALEVFSELGLVFLFFYLGLEFNIVRAIHTAKKIWSVGILDFLFNFGLIFLISKSLGFPLFQSVLIGGVAYASSSAITTKIIVDNHRIANPETELILGLMVFEDIVAPILLAFISAVALGGELSPLNFGFIILKVILVFAFAIGVAIFFKNHIANFIDRFIEEEIFTLFSFGGLILFAGITQFIGLSEALGAFLMGMIVSETGKSHDIEKIMFAIKDLAVAIFFFLFGASIKFSSNIDFSFIVFMFVIVIVSILGKFLTGFLGALIYGLSKRKAIETGLTIVNRGEFSIAMSKFAPNVLLLFIGVYVLIMSFVGILTAQYAPKIAEKIVPKKKKKKKKKKVKTPEYI